MTNTLLTLFFPIILAYTLVKAKYINSTLSKEVRTFVIKVAVPCRIFTSIYNTNIDTIKEILPLSLSYILISLLLILTSFIILIKVKDKKVKAAYMLTISFGNIGYMGWAVLDGALGVEGLTRGIFFTTLWWPGIYLGTFLIAKLTNIDSNLNVKDYLINMITPIIVLLLGILFNVFEIPIYRPLAETLTSFGDMTTPLILFSVGLTISITYGLQNIKKTILPVLLRPILGITVSLLIIIILRVDDPISKKSILIESTMPVAVLSVILGDMLNLDEKLISSILIVSTLLSVITIPLTLILVL